MDETMIIESKEVFNAVRSIYADLEKLSDEEIINHFRKFDNKNSIMSNIHDVKEIILFEEKYINKLSKLGIDTSNQNRNHPNTSIQIFDNQRILEEMPAKTVENTSTNCSILVNSKISINPISEMPSNETNNFNKDFSNISSFLLEQMIFEILFPFSPIDFILEDLDSIINPV